MGTHPIFESDFDCLTDCKMCKMCGTLCGMDRGPVPVTPREKDIEKYTREKAAQEYAARESALKRSASDKDDMISFLRPPKTAKLEYMEQTPAKFVFQCRDGDIQIPEYGLLRSDFYYQRYKARANEKDGYIYDYKQFAKSSVKYFTDALFGVMPECTDIVGAIELTSFLLFDGQADAGPVKACLTHIDKFSGH